MRLAGYESVAILRDWIGYVYPNVDSDGDFLIDGFERLIGTRPDLPDTDCDGLSDGEEILFYDMSSPEPAEHGYGDPRDGPCLFADGFESGDTSRWTEALVAR